MSKKNAVIVGAGPAGLAAAYTLSQNPDLNITLIEQGKEVQKRVCPSPKKCIKCGNCEKSNGIGGAGCFSDGKFIGETVIGNREIGTNLYEIIGREKEREYMVKGREFFGKFGVEFASPSDEKMTKAKNISRIAARNDMDYIFSLQAHIGTDKLPELISKIENELVERDVKIITQEKIEGFRDGLVYSKREENYYCYNFLVLAPGRKGADWLERVLKKNKMGLDYRAIDIGFRIETDAKVLEELVEVARDVKLSFRLPWSGELIRTFCVCPNGLVTRETYEEGFNLVNGASDSQIKTPNTNFSLLMSIPLTNSVNANNYADSIAKTFFYAGADRPVLQRLGDIQNKRRSKEEKILEEWRIQPTLRDVLVGKVGLGMPYSIQEGLLYGIDKLSAPGLMEGLNQASTLIYAPEMKRNGLRVITDEYLQTTKENVYIAGDGPGASRSIVGAAASGILAAEGILKNLE